MTFNDKILTWAQLSDWRKELRDAGRALVVTNGCFDVLHIGHATYLETASKLGDDLLVGINGDEGVRALKGPGRPINPERDRAGLVAALACVTRVVIFPEPTATRFLAKAEPDIYVKGGDYTLETLNQEERKTVESAGGRIEFIPFVREKSSTRIIEQIIKGQAQIIGPEK